MRRWILIALLTTVAVTVWQARAHAHAAAAAHTPAPKSAARAPAQTANAAVVVYLDRDGESRPASRSQRAVKIPAYTGGDRAWSEIVDCVRTHYAPFQVDIVEQRPAGGSYITAVVGGRASALGLNDRTTNGVGPYNGKPVPGAVVNVFSEVGTGPRDIENVCAVTAHEVGHALGLDHEYYCGDIMSYYLTQCGARRFVDATAACGENAARRCGNGAGSQNSYRQLAKTVGLRATPAVVAQRDPREDGGDVAPPQPPPRARPAQRIQRVHHVHRRVRRVYYYDGGDSGYNQAYSRN